MSKRARGALSPKMEEALFELLEGPAVSVPEGFRSASGRVLNGSTVGGLLHRRLALDVQRRRPRDGNPRVVAIAEAGARHAEQLLDRPARDGASC